MQRLITHLDTVSRYCLRFGGVLILLSAFMVTIDVVSRKIFGVTIGGADELSGYGFGIATMLALSAALIGRTNIRIDIGYQAFPKPMRALADLIALVLLVGFIGLIAWVGFGVFAGSAEHWSRSITPLRTPLAIPQAFWFAGMALAVVTGAVLIFAVLQRLFQRDWDCPLLLPEPCPLRWQRGRGPSCCWIWCCL